MSADQPDDDESIEPLDPSAVEEPAVKDRWWVETRLKKQQAAAPVPAAPVGSKFYRSGIGFSQEIARSRLTDLNLKLLMEANPPEAGWGYVQLAETTFSERERERIKEQLSVPPYARAVLVDCGRSVRVLFTGTPLGQRILDLTLGDNPSFDCWIDGEWVRERVFRDQRGALGAMRRYIREYLSPEGMAEWELLRAQV
jgi:hypothetical protein